MNRITRESPQIDRVACPWLIKRFINSDAQIFFIPFDQVWAKTIEFDAIPFDILDTELTHYEDQCTFDFFPGRSEIQDPALKDMAVIIPRVDTDDHSLASNWLTWGPWTSEATQNQSLFINMHQFSLDILDWAINAW